MADLNLRSKWIDDKTVKVSWNDRHFAEFDRGSGDLHAAIFGICFFAGLFLSLYHRDPTPGIIGTILAFGVCVLYCIPISKTKEITIGADITIFGGNQYRTAEITRFEYGYRFNLTGQVPERDGAGNQVLDPVLVRMWINDRAAVKLSENAWQLQDNHRIRNDLEMALLAVRKSVEKSKHDGKYGRVTSDGIPDYD